MKQIAIAGRTGKAGELRHTQDGDAVLSFSVAVDDGYGDKKSTMWFDCSVWGKRAKSLAPHIGKGAAVTVIGDLGKREHEGKTYLTVRVNELSLQGGGEKKPEPAPQQSSDGARVGRDLDDEIPFHPEFR